MKLKPSQKSSKYQFQAEFEKTESQNSLELKFNCQNFYSSYWEENSFELNGVLEFITIEMLIIFVLPQALINSEH